MDYIFDYESLLPEFDVSYDQPPRQYDQPAVSHEEIGNVVEPNFHTNVVLGEFENLEPNFDANVELGEYLNIGPNFDTNVVLGEFENLEPNFDANVELGEYVNIGPNFDTNVVLGEFENLEPNFDANVELGEYVNIGPNFDTNVVLGEFENLDPDFDANVELAERISNAVCQTPGPYEKRVEPDFTNWRQDSNAQYDQPAVSHEGIGNVEPNFDINMELGEFDNLEPNFDANVDLGEYVDIGPNFDANLELGEFENLEPNFDANVELGEYLNIGQNFDANVELGEFENFQPNFDTNVELVEPISKAVGKKRVKPDFTNWRQVSNAQYDQPAVSHEKIGNVEPNFDANVELGEFENLEPNFDANVELGEFENLEPNFDANVELGEFENFQPNFDTNVELVEPISKAVGKKRGPYKKRVKPDNPDEKPVSKALGKKRGPYKKRVKPDYPNGKPVSKALGKKRGPYKKRVNPDQCEVPAVEIVQPQVRVPLPSHPGTYYNRPDYREYSPVIEEEPLASGEVPKVKCKIRILAKVRPEYTSSHRKSMHHFTAEDFDLKWPIKVKERKPPQEEPIPKGDYVLSSVGHTERNRMLPNILEYMRKHTSKLVCRGLNAIEIINGAQLPWPRIDIDWLQNDILENHPDVIKTSEHSDDSQRPAFKWKLKYDIKNGEELVRLLQLYKENGFGGILLKDVYDSFPNAEKIMKSEKVRDKILVVKLKPPGASYVYYINPEFKVKKPEFMKDKFNLMRTTYWSDKFYAEELKKLDIDPMPYEHVKSPKKLKPKQKKPTEKQVLANL